MQCFVDHVDGKNRRGIVKGIVVSKGGVFKHGGQIFASRCQKFFLGDNDNYACWAQIFLRSCVNQIKVGNIHLAGEDVTGHITDYRHIEFGECFIFGAVDGVVGSDVYIRGVGFKAKLCRNIAVVFVSAGGRFICIAIEFGFGHGFFSPHAGVHIGCVFFSVEISGSH